jgi:hypothetical protein
MFVNIYGSIIGCKADTEQDLGLENDSDEAIWCDSESELDEDVLEWMITVMWG